MERPFGYKTDDEGENNGELVENGGTPSPSILVIDSYGGSRVNRKYPAMIREMSEKEENLICEFPIEPFHYREVKRHATENAMKACVECNVPMALTTQKEIPSWAVEMLTRHKFSEVSICVNTFDKKKWKILEPMADEPKKLLNSFIECFNYGVYTKLKIAPIVPGITSITDIFEVVDAVKHWAKTVEISPRSFTGEEFFQLRQKAKTEDMEKHYSLNLDSGRFEVLFDYWESVRARLAAFLDGCKLPLVVKA